MGLFTAPFLEKSLLLHKKQREVTKLKRKVLFLCAVWILSLTFSINTGYALVQTLDEIHCYKDIPFENSTPSQVRQWLSVQENITLEPYLAQYPDRVQGVASDFGTTFYVDFDFHIEKDGLYRIIFDPMEPIRTYTPEDHAIAVKRDIQHFLEIGEALIARYGQPTLQYFYTVDQKAENAYTFDQNQWTVDKMFAMFQNEPTFRAYWLWNNIEHRLVVGNDAYMRKKVTYMSYPSLVFHEEPYPCHVKNLFIYPESPSFKNGGSLQ